MMKIDRNNYELCFIDYFDGRLSREEKRALLDFLAGHPDLKSEFEEFEKNHSDIHEGTFQFKNTLKKQVGDLGEVDEDSIDEYSIAYLENDLNEEEKKALKDAVKQNTAFERTFRLYQLTKLQPDWKLVYKYKKQLKHFVLEKKPVLWAMGYAAAAAILIAGVIFINPAEEELPQQNQLTEASKKQDSPPKTVNIQETGTAKEMTPTSGKSSNTTTTARDEPQSQQSKVHPEAGTTTAEMKRLDTKPMYALNNRWQESISLSNAMHNNDESTGNRQTESGINEAQVNKVQTTDNRGIDLLGIAQAGVKVFNKLNERNIELEPAYSNGQLKSITVITEQRKITAPAI